MYSFKYNRIHEYRGVIMDSSGILKLILDLRLDLFKFGSKLKFKSKF